AAPLDVTPPSVASADFLYQTGQAIAVRFSEPVNPATVSGADLVLQPGSGGDAITPESVVYDAATRTATFSLSPILADGNYRATLPAGAVTDLANNPLSPSF